LTGSRTGSPTLRRIQKVLSDGQNPYIDISNLMSVLLHYVEETGELIKTIRKNGVNCPLVAKELGDCQILLCFVASSISIDLQEATLNKIQENIREGKFKPSLHPDLESLFK